MFNAKKRRIEQLESDITALKSARDKDYKNHMTAMQEWRDKLNESEMLAARDREISEYKLGLVEQLMKQLTININMNKGKK